MKTDKEKKYKILETIILDFNSAQVQYSSSYDSTDNAQVIVKGSDVYLLYNGRRQLTINGTDLIELYVKKGSIKEIND